MRVDDSRHDGLAGKIHTSRTRGGCLSLLPTLLMRLFSIRKAEFSIGALLSPVISRAPSNRMTPPLF